MLKDFPANELCYKKPGAQGRCMPCCSIRWSLLTAPLHLRCSAEDATEWPLENAAPTAGQAQDPLSSVQVILP